MYTQWVINVNNAVFTRSFKLCTRMKYTDIKIIQSWKYYFIWWILYCDLLKIFFCQNLCDAPIFWKTTARMWNYNRVKVLDLLQIPQYIKLDIHNVCKVMINWCPVTYYYLCHAIFESRSKKWPISISSS